MVTGFPEYNVSPVSEAWNRPGLRGQGGVHLNCHMVIKVYITV